VICRVVLVSAMMLFSVIGHADEKDEKVDYQNRKVAIPQITVPPRLDGDLSDEAWKNAIKLEKFTRFGNSSTPVTEKTEAYICADGKNMYVAFYCHDTEPGKIRASETQRNSRSVWSDDHVGIQIDSQNTRQRYSTFSVNPIGTQIAQIEGGTADNLTWIGDWKAKAKRVPDGWIAEMAIPFKLLRYPKGAAAMGIVLDRRLAREQNNVTWPDFPADGQNFSGRVRYFVEATGLNLPENRPRPVFLPYVLGTLKSTASGQTGLDIKYPISTTFTGLATLNPDFKTVEQSVADINFSYNEQFINETRPFFAEGKQFLPYSDMFYAPRISSIDEGVKLVGKEGNTSLGFLTTHKQAAKTGRTSTAFLARHDQSIFSNSILEVVADNQNGRPDNRVARISGSNGWLAGNRRHNLEFSTGQSWQAGKAKGANYAANWSTTQQGKWGAYVGVNQLDKDFVNDLGLVLNKDSRGVDASLSQDNTFDRGPVGSYFVNTSYSRYTRTNGTFFYDSVSLYGSVENLQGRGIGFNVGNGNRRDSPASPEIFHDRDAGGYFFWNGRTLFQGGSVAYSAGPQGGQPTTNQSVRQGFLINQRTSAQVTARQQKRGGTTTRQQSVTGTWRVDNFRTMSMRYLSQNGIGNTSSVGRTNVNNLYFAYSQRLPQGMDAFLLIGDPNAERTKNQVTLKLVRPY
jgi:hypothetical protein